MPALGLWSRIGCWSSARRSGEVGPDPGPVLRPGRRGRAAAPGAGRPHADEELFLLVALTVGLGAAAADRAVGLSLALGAFLAGLLINESDSPTRRWPGCCRCATCSAPLLRHRRRADRSRRLSRQRAAARDDGRAGRGGQAGDPGRRRAALRQTSGRRCSPGWGWPRSASSRSCSCRPHAGEGYIGQDIYQATLATSLITILLNATLVQLVSRRIGSFRAAARRRSTPRRPTDGLAGHVILCGYGRVGSAVAEALETFGIRYVVIETRSRYRARSADARYPELLR